MIVHVGDEPVPFTTTSLGTDVRAVTADDGGVFVTGTCDSMCDGDSLWVARYDFDLELKAEKCHCSVPYRGRAIAGHVGFIVVVGGSRDPGERTGIVAYLDGALDVLTLVLLSGAGDDLDAIEGVDVNGVGAGIVSSGTEVVVAVSCEGAEVHVEEIGADPPMTIQSTCETANDLMYGPNGNIAIIRLGEVPTVEAFGGIHRQQPTDIALSDAHTLWMAGRLFGAGIALSGAMDHATELANLTTVEGAGFIARFDLTPGKTEPTALYVLDNAESLPSNRTSDIAFDSERQRVVVAGNATLGACLRPWDGTCMDNYFAGSRDFLAFIPTIP